MRGIGWGAHLSFTEAWSTLPFSICAKTAKKKFKPSIYANIFIENF